jgi:hypothetical protein
MGKRIRRTRAPRTGPGPDVGQVTKAFYDRFKVAFTAFARRIQGIPDDHDRTWYASVQVCRLLFLCFLRSRGCPEQPGLFASHALERAYPAARIPEEAVAELLQFLQGYEWRLESGPLRSKQEITPDVLGYILEQYINQKQMGAYYTREDVTRYISTNTIIPCLLEAVQARRPGLFGEQGLAARLLRANPDRYLYAEMLAPEGALPLETQREYLERRTQAAEVRRHLAQGRIDSPDSLVAHNLDLSRLALDLIRACDDPDLALAFYESLTSLRVLDPTCGSGAFLIAVLDVLAPLYAACTGRLMALPGEPVPPLPLPGPDRDFFICETILFRNLFGMDIMEEAAEICTLRLYLRLAALAPAGADLPPLPDLGLQIRTGNALGALQVWERAFPAVLAGGGFDVIIGNPPYVELRNVKEYTVQGYRTQSCGDLYACTLERALDLVRQGGRLGFIVPMSAFAGNQFRPLQELCYQKVSPLFISFWSGDAHPSRLFEGVDKRLSIVLGRRSRPGAAPCLSTSRYHKWYSGERPSLFHRYPRYLPVSMGRDAIFPGSVPKICSTLERNILARLKGCRRTVGDLTHPSGAEWVYYTRKVSFFLQFLDFIPEIRDGQGALREPSELKWLRFGTAQDRNLALACLSSSLFYWYFIVGGDCRNLNRREVTAFPVPDQVPAGAHDRLAETLQRLMADYRRHATPRTIHYANGGAVTVPYFDFRLSKPILDELDVLLAPYYGLTEAEVDFVRHYDEKYRMGSGGLP